MTSTAVAAPDVRGADDGGGARPARRDASDVYDRQIRLWGREAQARMDRTRVLYIHVTGVTGEVIKNLTLAGVRVALCDDRPFPAAMADTPCFLLTNPAPDQESGDEPEAKKPKRAPQTVAEALKPLIEELNPLLDECEIVRYSDLTEERLARYGIVVASRMEDMRDACRIAAQVTEAGGKFFLADCFGMNGACIMDLGPQHKYRPEKGKTLLDEVELQNYVPLEMILHQAQLQDATNRFYKQPPDVWVQYRCILEHALQTSSFPVDLAQFTETITAWIGAKSPTLLQHPALSTESLEELARVARADVAPVCAVLGGLIGNEVIKAISGKGEPVNNTLLFDGVTCKGFSFLVQPKQ